MRQCLPSQICMYGILAYQKYPPFVMCHLASSNIDQTDYWAERRDAPTHTMQQQSWRRRDAELRDMSTGASLLLRAKKQQVPWKTLQISLKLYLGAIKKGGKYPSKTR